MKIPAISVVIPMYNAEKYIEQCLESILNQTFDDYEVIIVDDCSTDNSIKKVENMMPKFNERLKIIKCKKNSGGAAIPRNIGMKIARGKYILPLDNDDLILNNALEILYNTAEETAADVLHMEKWLEPFDDSEEINQNTKFKINTFEEGGFVKKVTVETEDLAERMNLYCKKRFSWHVWNKLFRRDFIMENNLEFPNVKVIDDMIFSFYCLCLAKKYVRIPNVLNIYRVRKNSFLHKPLSMQDSFRQYVKNIINASTLMGNFMKEIKFFSEQNQFIHMVINFVIKINIEWGAIYYTKLPFQISDLILREELPPDFEDVKDLNIYSFAAMNHYYLTNLQLQNQINRLQQQILSLQNKKKKFGK